MTWTADELMICCAARLLEDGCTAAIGTGLPCKAALLAQRTHAPNLTIFFEAGSVAPLLPKVPISVGDSRTFHRAVMAASMAEVMQFCQRGLIDYTFLSGAQIDPFGNLNSTVIGDHRKPKVRLPGSGGANDLASFCRRTLIIMKHDPRKFVATLDFLTTPGWLDGPGGRERVGLPSDTGPYRVITDLAVLDFAADSKRMRVRTVHPGVTFEQVQAATSFPLLRSDLLEITPPPTMQEMQALQGMNRP